MKPEIKINLFTIIKVIRLIAKFFHEQNIKIGTYVKSKTMCFKKSTPIIPAKKRALLFAINNYPGTQNDLNGCLNDEIDVEARLNKDFPGFDIRKFKDSQVTGSKFVGELTNAIRILRAGDLLFVHYSGHGTQVPDKNGDEADGYDEAIYLWDEPVVDDTIRAALAQIPAGAMVVLAFDSCFSGTITRDPLCAKTKFMRYQGNPIMKTPNRKMTDNEIGYVVFSGCEEHQTSADAQIGGRYNGAFTYFWLASLKKGMTYQQWFDKLHTYLPGNGYDQAPTLEGDKNLFNNIVFT
jgi:metacaspase-1